jgi:hypothetical protein
MGVLACSRQSCENIMCDIYIPSVGYICNSCKEEFINSNPVCYSEVGLIDRLNEFMGTEKVDKLDYPRIDLYYFFDSYTRT